MSGQTAINRTMTRAEWSLLVILSILWGGSFFFIGVAVKELPPFTIVALRVSIAAVVLNVVIRLMGIALPCAPGAWRAFAGMGALNNLVPFSLLVWAQGHIASGVASILNATTPLFTVVVAHLFTSDEKLTPGRVAGVILGIIGVAVMIGTAGMGLDRVELLAEAACLFASLLYALSAIFGRRFKTLGLVPLQAVTGMVTASSLMLIPLALVVDRPWHLPAPHLATVLAVAGLALLSTAFAYLIYFRLLASAGATNLALVTFLIPVSAILLGIAFLGEALALRHVAGMALIGAGLAAIDGRLWQKLTKAPNSVAHSPQD